MSTDEQRQAAESLAADGRSGVADGRVAFPHQSGDDTVIAPGCFVSKDRAVLSYEGVNYYRRPEDHDQGSVELVSMDPALLDAATTRLTHNVIVHVIGGMEVEGTLQAVNDDLTITVVDRRRQYDIALSSIAVLEGDR